MAPLPSPPPIKKSCIRTYKELLARWREEHHEELILAKLRYEAKRAELQANPNPKKFYNYAKTSTKSNGSVDCLEVNGQLLTSNYDKTTALDDFFSSVMVKEPTGLPHFTYRGPAPNECLYSTPIRKDTVLKYMMELDSHKAVGPDGIHPMVLKNVGRFCKPLRILFEHSIQRGILPSDWRDANIYALHKKGSRKFPNNYRPVSLTSQVVKLMEMVILEQLLECWNQNNIFTCEQHHGFQSRCFCLTNLLESLNDCSVTYDQPHIGTNII